MIRLTLLLSGLWARYHACELDSFPELVLDLAVCLDFCFCRSAHSRLNFLPRSAASARARLAASSFSRRSRSRSSSSNRSRPNISFPRDFCNVRSAFEAGDFAYTVEFLILRPFSSSTLVLSLLSGRERVPLPTDDWRVLGTKDVLRLRSSSERLCFRDELSCEHVRTELVAVGDILNLRLALRAAISWSNNF